LNGQLTASAKTRAPRLAQGAKRRAAAGAQSKGLQAARPRGFQSGPTNPSAVRAAHVAGNKARRTEAARRRTAAARARANPRGLALAGAGVRGPLSTRDRSLVLDAALSSGMSQLEAGALAAVSQPAVSRLLKRTQAALGTEAGTETDPAALTAAAVRNVKKPAGGRPTLLTPPVTAGVLTAVKKDPFGGVGAVHRAVLEQGVSVSPRTLRNWFDALDVHARATNSYADLNERLIHGLLNHIEAMEAALASGELGLQNLAYADQTPVYICAGHKTAYSDTVVFGDGGDAKGGKKIGNLWAVVTTSGCLRAWFTDLNGDEQTTKDFFLSDTPPPGWINLHGPDGNIFDLLVAHGKRLPGRCWKMLLLIDRLGKSGSSAYPVAGHHTPILRVRAREAGCLLLLLPPKGALVNPIELWNMHVKNAMNAMQPAGAPTDGWQQYIRGPRSKDEALTMLKQAFNDIDANAALFRWCYYQRATGADALRRLEGHVVAHAVRAACAAQPVAPFDVIEAGRAPRARKTQMHFARPRRTRATSALPRGAATPGGLRHGHWAASGAVNYARCTRETLTHARLLLPAGAIVRVARARCAGIGVHVHVVRRRRDVWSPRAPQLARAEGEALERAEVLAKQVRLRSALRLS